MKKIKTFEASTTRELDAKVNMWNAEMRHIIGLGFKTQDIQTSYDQRTGTYIATVTYRQPSWLP